MGLENQVLFITGASRGIGKEIALLAAKDGASIIIASKTADPHPKLPGTIYTAAEEIEKAGGKALPLSVDIRDETQILQAVQKGVETFGKIDILVNNASAIFLSDTLHTPAKKLDLMFQVNTRGTFLCSQACLPYLKKSQNPHILNMSPPLNLNPRWFKDHLAYTLSKYGMSECVLGMAAEFAAEGIAVNALWPRTVIATVALQAIFPDPEALKEIQKHCRKPSIMAEAAYQILSQPSRSATGRFYIDEEVLRAKGVIDFSSYAIDPTANLQLDFFIE